jgi:hypothetical protein
MASLDDFQPMTTHRIQLLKLAQEVLFHEYIDKKAQLHNQWSADADVAWRTRGVRLPYPSFPPYPDNSMIITKAMEMERFLNNDFLSTTTSVAPQTKIEQPKVEPVQPVKVEQPVVEEPKVEEPKPENKSIIGNILEENEYFKKEDEDKQLLSDKPSLLPNWFARK